MLTATTISFRLAFSALFSIVNPLCGALIYGQVTAGRSRLARGRLAWRVAFYSTIVMVMALLAGAPLLGFFEITLSVLSASRPASGSDLVVFYIGSTLVAVAIGLTIGMYYASADRVKALLGQVVSRVVRRLAALILLCVGTQILLTGLSDTFAHVVSSVA